MTLMLVSAAAAGVVPVSVPVLVQGRHRNFEDNLAACSLGCSDILHWQPNLRIPDSDRSTSLASAAALASAVALESVLVQRLL